MIDRRLARVAALCGVIITGAAIAGGLHLWRGGGAQADHSASEVTLVAVDVNTSDNTATSLGALDSCVQIAANASVDVDIIVDAIPADRPLTAFQFNLFYDPAIVNVTAVNHEMLLAANEFQPLAVLTNPVPDSDGDFLVAINDITFNQESGPGVLARITLAAKGGGVSNLSAIHIDLRDDHNESIPVQSTGAANLAVGSACPAEAPTPVTTPPERPPGGQSPTAAPGTTPATGGTPDSGQTEDTPGLVTSVTPAPLDQQAVQDARQQLLETLSAGLNVRASLDTVNVGDSLVVLAALADENDAAVAGKDVAFKIEEQPGDDANLDGEAEATKTSDSDGIAQVTLNAGSKPGKIVVSASAEDESKNVTITVREKPAAADDNGGGIGAWLAALIVAAVIALAGGGFAAYRWLRRRPVVS